MSGRQIAIVCIAICSFAFLLAAFLSPRFVKSEFALPKAKKLTDISKSFDSPCDPLCAGVQSQLPSSPLPSWASEVLAENCIALCEANQDHVDNTRDLLLDRMLGGMPSAEGKLVSWAECMSPDKEGKSFEQCMESWVLARAGMPVGSRSYGSIVKDVWDNHLMLGVLILLFTGVFPVIRIGLTILIVFDSAKTMLKLHTYVAKFSMTEVLLVAFIITFFKAESFSFQMSFDMGGWFFGG